ncbi:hypothetical protein THIOKS1500020 [Thiocapsa sp. KS1]|nr:hypothetical protein THIOKS1500020 [Thiocapsa sp. KS1]
MVRKPDQSSWKISVPRSAWRRRVTIGSGPRYTVPLPSTSTLLVTLAPHLLSCLRIDAPVTSRAARLNTWLAAHDYPGGTRTRLNTRPCQAAPSPFSPLIRVLSVSFLRINYSTFLFEIASLSLPRTTFYKMTA